MNTVQKEPVELVSINLNIPFPTSRDAEIVYDVLKIDPEPPRSRVTKILKLKDNQLIVELSASTARQLRVAINNFLSSVGLVCETFEAFGPPLSEKYLNSTGDNSNL